MFTFDINPNDPACIERALKTEWLLTNGLGGYAMGTVLGVNTRRYHGLLVAATKPPVGRIVALHSMIEQLVIPSKDGSKEVIDLSTQQFVEPDGEPMLHPSGWRWLRLFEYSASHVRWTYNVRGMTVVKSFELLSGRNGCQSLMTIAHAKSSCRLRIRPFVLMRDFHALGADESLRESQSAAQGFQIESTHGVLQVDSMRATWHHSPQWWNKFAYTQDRQRGQDWVEDASSPGVLESAEDANSLFTYATLTEPVQIHPLFANDLVSFLEMPIRIADTRNSISQLKKSADQFLVWRSHKHEWKSSVIAGYPWFGDWGRDTMISLPGLMLCTKRYDEARSCLLMFAKNIMNGLIPNVFDDYGGPAHYNTVDASLWFIHAVHELWTATSTIDIGLLRACRAIIAAYRKGTDFHIFMDTDGLISAGDEGSQLTWMDAKRDGVVFTPRHGKPVEVNALWHNALCCMAEMTDDPRERDELRALSRKAAQSFQAKFWWNERQCLHDVLQPQPSGQLRPNQIFAVSLPFSPLNEAQQRAVVKIVGDRLLTPYGLRTLDRDDPNYHGRYDGSLFERDRAYHNGTVWPWLIGPYCEALFRVEKFSDAARKKVREILQPLLNELDVPNGGCVNQLAEVYDGDAPQRPNGCPAQAWSVAEVLRVLTMIEPV